MRFATDALNAMTPEGIREVQEARLRRQLAYGYDNSELYRRKFAAAGAHPRDVRTLDDFRALPIFLTKQDERESQQESLERFGHPFGMHLCARLEDIELTSTTSGTTGTPTFTYTFSRRDLNGPVADLWAFMFRYAGVQPGDRVLFAYALGVYATSMLLWGLRRAGAIPIDVDVRGGAEPILQFADLTRPVAFATTPSLADYLIARAPKSLGKEVGAFGFRSLLLCGEPGAGIAEVKKRLEHAYGARVYDYWAPGGLGFGLACDADDYHGLHCYAPDYNLYQDDLIDPATGKPIDVVEGAIGEAVHTSLDRDASPMIRYAYGDIVQVFTAPCPGCGFAGKRLKFVGRSDDMLIVKGVNVYPAALKSVVAGFMPRVTGELRIVLEGPPPRVVPPLRVKLEHGVGVERGQLDALAREIVAACHARLKLSPAIEWLPPGTFERSLRKTSLVERAGA